MFHVLIDTGLILSGGFATFQIVATLDQAMPGIASALAGHGADRSELPAPVRHRAVRSAARLGWSRNAVETSATARRA